MTAEAIETTEAVGIAPARSTETALRVLRGDPTAEELAALVAVLAARASGDAGETGATGDGAAGTARPVSCWADRSRYVRSGRPEFGAGSGWRASALPR